MKGLRLDGRELLPPASRSDALRAARAVLNPARGLTLGLTFVDDETIRELNQTWRGIDRPTDVLSFAAWDGEPLAGLEDELGDLVIAVGVASRQAEELGHSLVAEIGVLVAHGLLHLCGYDHETQSERRAMAELEVSLLDQAGLDCQTALIGRVG